ncbi:glycine-N-acyltransferase-like protein 3 isoform X2 [Phalacrocorax carbo]|uniref:glycine-N-acyltransferase-like protein 3 isoform X2 n=1 Tax=Phalacrocorax carbo TaxID=9209 RepID=UPI0031195F22
MLILTCPAQLQRLEEALRRSLPLALPVLGAVMNINRGNPGEFEVVVDSWPHFGAVLARPSREECGFLPGRGRLPGTARDPRLPALGHRLPHLCTLPEPRLDPDVRVGSLSPAHVDLLNETWAYGGNNRSRRYLAELLGRFPNVCLQDRAGQPLCWVLTDAFGTGTHSYTLPAHRRHGHMRAVLALAARRAQARGFPTFGHTATGNRPMQRLQEELGHRQVPELCRFVLHNPGLGRD